MGGGRPGGGGGGMGGEKVAERLHTSTGSRCWTRWDGCAPGQEFCGGREGEDDAAQGTEGLHSGQGGHGRHAAQQLAHYIADGLPPHCIQGSHSLIHNHLLQPNQFKRSMLAKLPNPHPFSAATASPTITSFRGLDSDDQCWHPHKPPNTHCSHSLIHDHLPQAI